MYDIGLHSEWGEEEDMKRHGRLMKMATPMGALVLLIAVAGNDAADCIPITTIPEVGCSAAADCEGLPHDLCLDGGWQCVNGKCEYKCEPDETDKCVISGCSGEICAEEPMGSYCIWLDWYECLELTECGLFGPDGACAWKSTDAFDDCVLSKPCQSYGECPAGYTCAVSNCSDPDTCVPTCSPQPGAGECMTSEDCPPGLICEATGYCPPCVYGDPACKMPCWAVGECVVPPGAECKDLCDCYDLYGMKFQDPCYLMCPMCGNFWQCEDGLCAEHCGVIPAERQDCFPID